MTKKIKKFKLPPGLQKKSKPLPGPAGTASGCQYLLQEALALQKAGLTSQAETLYRQILAVEPNHPEALNFLGMQAYRAGQNETAIGLLGKALAVKPSYNEACFNLGLALQTVGRAKDAIAVYQRLIAMDPTHLEAQINLGNTLVALGRLDEAVTSFRRVIELKPDFAAAHNNLGIIFKSRKQLAEAVACFRKAVALKPDFAAAHSNLASALKDQGQLVAAVASFHRALTVKPDFAAARSNLLLCLNYLPDLSPSEYLEEARRFGRHATEKVGQRFSSWNCPAEPDRLRVGMVSGDLNRHPVGHFLENLLANLDLSRIELFAYPTTWEEDELTARLKSRFESWKPLPGLPDQAAATLIHADGIHILLDLSGHTSYNRLPVFAWKPAPVQASWLGYFASTGVAEMDYLIADPVSVPESHRQYFSEKIWYLPETRLCFSPPATGEELAVSPLPALGNGYITFGCFQNVTKINDVVLATWARIMANLPKSRLRLQNQLLDFPTIREQLRVRLADHGIDPDRVTLLQSVPRPTYLAAHGQIDLILDTFPFPGGTTTCAALWMGVPTLTLAGNNMISRQGASLLSCAGLPDWIAETGDEYVAKAAALTADLEELARLRTGLRKQVLASPLFDGARFASHFEEAVWGMWEKWCEAR